VWQSSSICEHHQNFKTECMNTTNADYIQGMSATIYCGFCCVSI